MLRLALNAVSLAPGGGLNGLIGYLRAWRELNSPLAITLYASRRPVLDSVRAARPDIEVVPYAVDASSGKHFLLQQFDLGGRIDSSGADVVMTTQQGVGRCHIPQLVHHRNLKRFLDLHPWRTLLRGRADEPIKDIAARKALRSSRCNVFISDFLRREAERFVPESAPRNHIVYNGISSDLLLSATRMEPSWQGGGHLVAITSGGAHKDNPTLLRSLRYVMDAEPLIPWDLTIMGDDAWSREKALADELGVRDRVRFEGYLTHEEMEPLLRRSVCLVFTSTLEGFGNPPIEAMARCCPTVASNVTAMPEVIGDAGLLVEPRRPDQFGAAILKLYRDRSLRDTLVQRGLKRIQDFKWSDSAAKMFSLLEATAHGAVADATGN